MQERSKKKQNQINSNDSMKSTFLIFTFRVMERCKNATEKRRRKMTQAEMEKEKI